MDKTLNSLICLLLFLVAQPTFAATRYVALTGSDANSCAASEDIDTPKRTFSSAVACIQPGDTLYIRGGLWTEQLNVQDAGKSGTSTAWITIAGFPGETVTIRYATTTIGSYGPVKARGLRGYFIFKDFILDGVNMADENKWQIRDGNHHFTLEGIEIVNFPTSAVYIEANDIVIRNCRFHNSSGPQNVGYAVYYHHGTTALFEGNEFDHMPGGAMQVYPGPLSGITIRRNKIHDNNSNSSVPIGGILVATAASSGGNVSGVDIYENEIVNNGSDAGSSAGSDGVRVRQSTFGTVSNIKIYNNVITGNKRYGVAVENGASAVEVRNNILSNNGNTEFGSITGGAATLSHNACTAAESCGTTGKVTLASGPTSCTVSTSDHRLRQGTNPCRDAGTTVSTRPIPVGATDIGAFEQGVLSSAVANDGIDLTFAAMTPSILPSSGATGITIACVGCTGTPVVASTSVSGAATVTMHLTVTGISAPGSCTVTVGATNITDSLFVGGIRGSAQGVNSASTFNVSGSCANSGTGSGSGSPSGSIAYWKLNEGAGLTANDETANNNDGVLSSGLLWVAGITGTAVEIPTDTTYRHIEAPFGASTNMATASGATCAVVTLNAGLSQKVVFSSGYNGAGLRLYHGVATIGGQLQWGIGIQTSGFSGTGSEFPATTNRTAVCLTWGGGTATLWVNGVKGTQSGKSVKTYTGYITAPTNFRYGNDGTFTNNNGGYSVDEIAFWDTLPSDATLVAYYTDRFSGGAATSGLAQVAHQFQYPHTYGGVVGNYGLANGSVPVIAGGAVAVKFQIDCTTVDCAAFTPAVYYSTSEGGSFNLLTPSSLGADGVSMYGTSFDPYLQTGFVSGLLSGALTPVTGFVVREFSTGPLIDLAQNNSVVMTYLFRFGAIPNQTRCFALREETGSAFAGGYSPATGACVRVIESRSGAN